MGERHAAGTRRSQGLPANKGVYSEEDHPRGRRCGGRNHGSRLVRLGAPGRNERYQTQTGKLNVEVSTGYFHTFDVAVNPCDGSFTGTGFSAQLNANETIKGSLINGQLSFEATYTDQSNYPGYKWFTTSPGATGTSIPAGDSFFGVFSAEEGASATSRPRRGRTTASTSRRCRKRIARPRPSPASGSRSPSSQAAEASHSDPSTQRPAFALSEAGRSAVVRRFRRRP